MATRLDRLFVLLDTGSTPLIRKSAAEQLGQVQKLHPHELNNLLAKIHQYLKSTSWDTRIAAGQAVEAIVRNVPQWEPCGAPKQDGENSGGSSDGRLSLSHFSVQSVLKHGTSLLASEGAEFEDPPSALIDKASLVQQRQLLNKRLGLQMAGTLGIRTDNLFTDDDLINSVETLPLAQLKSQPCASDLVKQQLEQCSNRLSAREKNKAKRKARLYAKQMSRESQESENSEYEAPMKKAKRMTVSPVPTVDDIKPSLDQTTDNTLNMEETDEWPFETFCEVLMCDLFHTSWETRHGAAVGLRDVIKLHGRGAGKTVDTPANMMLLVNQSWLSDLGLRLLCILALDRFGDYVSDEVVAPVRETSAQTLGVVLKYLEPGCILNVTAALLQLLAQQQWEVRHGGLLGLKYMLAVRQDLTSQLLPMVLPSIFAGLQDPDDDVRAVAASALLPVSDTLVTQLPHQVPCIVICLWETLVDLDDLTASTNSIMNLLATLLAHPRTSIRSCLHEPLSALVPRLWPFLRHNISSVKKAALETYHTILCSSDPQCPVQSWLPPILADSLRHIYQRSLLDNKQDILQLVEKVWEKLISVCCASDMAIVTLPWLSLWLCLLMQPSKLPFDKQYLLEANHRGKVIGKNRLQTDTMSSDTDLSVSRDCLGVGAECVLKLDQDRDDVEIQARITASRLLGELFCNLVESKASLPVEAPETATDCISKLMLFHLQSRSALQRLAIAQILRCWSKSTQITIEDNTVSAQVLDCLNESIYYDEITISFTRMQNECRDFMASLKQHVSIDALIPAETILNLEQAMSLCTTVFDQIKGQLNPKVLQTLEERRKQLHATVSQTHSDQQLYATRVQSSLAGCLVLWKRIPEKLNPIIRPLMDSIKKEENSLLQKQSAESIAQLMRLCCDRPACPNGKIVKNLCTFLCSDASITPVINIIEPLSDDEQSTSICDSHSGILTLSNQLKAHEKIGRSWGRKSSLTSTATAASASVSSVLPREDKNNAAKQKALTRNGAEQALVTIAELFGESLPEKLPVFWQTLTVPLFKMQDMSKECKAEEECTEMDAQDLVNSLQLLETVASSLHETLLKLILDKLPLLCQCLHHVYTAVRHMASRCIGILCRIRPADCMVYVIVNVVPMLGATENIVKRQGSCEAISNIIDKLGLSIVPYIVLLMVPVLGRMSDRDEAVRLSATQCFATLIRLMPLEAGAVNPPEMSAALEKQREQERRFLEQLIDVGTVEDYRLSVPIKAELRKYQQNGINWLAFLNKYNLHGILCDDMGLGKTLMSICILAGDHQLRDEKYKSSKQECYVPLPSLVVCPPTLTGHWIYEVEKFIAKDFLRPLHYTGPPVERQRLQTRVKKCNLVVASYDIVRNDIDFFGSKKWNYCILDEGHIIKNGKTKLTKAVKTLQCNHRLILSGTPIQNNVFDLWSLFDFLMPGFLGSERQFQNRYGKPILQSRDAKSTSKEQEAGALAMEALHRQVLPFILRRLKEDVLQDLPPKIIQDYYCDLSSIQVELYEDFAQSHVKTGLEESVLNWSEEESSSEKKATNKPTHHIFQALQYLRKVCNHPALVLTPQHPRYKEVMAQVEQKKTNIHDLQFAPKLRALRQLLLDCGIGVGGASPAHTSGNHMTPDTPVVNQHRALIFCQLKSMLNMVENDLIKAHMPSVTYLRLDGSIPAGSRHGIVNRFNNDPSIDLLLLTTHVGGLGLNLTGADTVIFIEHDWNPMKDLQVNLKFDFRPTTQKFVYDILETERRTNAITADHTLENKSAMDRAHRIGQKRVVNVYRLITRGTLEEKIMGLQKFKLTVANTVITQDNSSLHTMGTSQLLDLFSLDEREKGENATESKGDKANKLEQRRSMKSILDDMDELWDEKQYDTEYNLDTFIQSLK